MGRDTKVVGSLTSRPPAEKAKMCITGLENPQLKQCVHDLTCRKNSELSDVAVAVDIVANSGFQQGTHLCKVPTLLCLEHLPISILHCIALHKAA